MNTTSQSSQIIASQNRKPKEPNPRNHQCQNESGEWIWKSDLRRQLYESEYAVYLADLKTYEKIIFYRGYSIEEDYRNPYSNVPEYMYYPTAEGVDHDADYDGDGYTYCGNCHWADSIEEAKDMIWEKVMTALPDHKVILNGREYLFAWIEDAIRFCDMWKGEEIWINGQNPATVNA